MAPEDHEPRHLKRSHSSPSQAKPNSPFEDGTSPPENGTSPPPSPKRLRFFTDPGSLAPLNTNSTVDEKKVQIIIRKLINKHKKTLKLEEVSTEAADLVATLPKEFPEKTIEQTEALIKADLEHYRKSYAPHLRERDEIWKEFQDELSNAGKFLSRQARQLLACNNNSRSSLTNISRYQERNH